jgi:cell division septation protein DedD
MPVRIPPAPMEGSFSVVIGTFDSVRQVEFVEESLLGQKLPVYTVDILMPAGDIQRRVLIGRYATREEAEAARQGLDATLSAARVIPGVMERLRVLP